MTRGGILCAVVAVLLFVIELLPLHESHGHHWWHMLPGFDLLYGFIGCVAIIVASMARLCIDVRSAEASV